MAKVYIPAQLRTLTGGVTQVDLPGTSVRELVQALDQRFPGIAARLCSGDQLTMHLGVAVDGTFSQRGLRTAVKPDSEVHFLPALGGG